MLLHFVPFDKFLFDTSSILCLQVGHLVLANSDYVIDSICRQLRHLDLNPQMPNVLAVMLSYIGIGHKILPLLEEPVCIYHSRLKFEAANKIPCF